MGNADAVQARLLFEGEPSGSLDLSVALTAARSISADFLGVDQQEVSERQIADVVCELANMICGAVLSRVELATFHLRAPAIVRAGFPIDHAANTAVCSVETGSGPLTAILSTEVVACSTAEKPGY